MTKEIGTRVITMSNSTPVRITSSDWKPTFVLLDSNGSRKHITLREHVDDKRAIVYAIQKDAGDRFPKHSAGVLCGIKDINETILDVAEEMAEKANDDTWMTLADRLIARRSPIKI